MCFWGEVTTGNYWVGGSGTWVAASTSFATTSGGTAGAAQATTGALVFDTASTGTQVSGTVTVANGLTFGANGIRIFGGTINLSGASAAANTITIDDGTSTASISSALTGTNGLTKAGNGILNLSSSVFLFSSGSTYSGTTTVSAGTLQLGGNYALGTSSVSITAGAALDLAGVTLVNANALTVNGTGISTNGSLINSHTNAVSYTGAITLGSDSTITAGTGNITLKGGITTASGKSLTINGASDVTISTAKITGAGGLTKNGAGTLTLNVASDFTGGLTINAGTVTLGSTAALNSTAGSENAVTFGSASTGTLSLNGNNSTIAGLNTNATPGTTFIKNGSASNNATLTIGNSTNANSTYAGTIQDGSTGTLAINKSGTGTLTLSGANTFTGSLTLSAGNLKVSSLGAGGAASPLGAATDVPGSIIFKGGNLEYAGSGETLTRDFTVGNGGAGFISSGTGALNIGQDAQMDFDNAAASNRTLSLGGTTDIAVENIFNPTKFDPAEINNLFTKLVKQDVNKWIVKGAGAGFVDNASTELNVDGGELGFAVGALGTKSTINVGSATLGWYNGNTEDLSGRIYLNNTAAAAFNIPSGTVTLLNSFNGTNGGLATTASLTKYGTGTLELGAANNFSGGLTVSTGTVKASFAGSVGSGAVSVSNNATLVVNALLANKINVTLGGTLAGNGLGTNTDDGVTIEDGGILSPNGDTLGTLSFSKLTLNGGSKVKWQLQNAADTAVAGVGYDTLVVTTLNLSNAISTKKKIIVEVTSAGPASGFVKTKLNKFEFANITIDLANGFNVTNLFSIDASQFEIDNNLTNDHLVWSMQYAADRDMMYVTTMIPEPSTYGLGLGALALAAVAIRRRKQKKSVA